MAGTSAACSLTFEEVRRPLLNALHQGSPEEGAQVQGLPGASPPKTGDQGGQGEVSGQRQ